MSQQDLPKLFEELKTLDNSLNNQMGDVKKSRQARKTITTEIIEIMEREGLDFFENYKLVVRSTKRRASVNNIIEEIIGKIQDENVEKLLTDAKAEINEQGSIIKKIMLIKDKKQ